MRKLPRIQPQMLKSCLICISKLKQLIMKRALFLIISLYFSATAVAQNQYPIKRILKTSTQNLPNKVFRDSSEKYTITTIDSILDSNDTIFNVRYFYDTWYFYDDTSKNHYSHRELKYGGLLFKGHRAGLWMENERFEVPGLILLNGYAYYFKNQCISREPESDIWPLSSDKYYFLNDTAYFCVTPKEPHATYAPDTLFFKVTSDKSWMYIGDLLVDSSETCFLADKVNEMLEYDRKYRIILDSLKNARKK